MLPVIILGIAIGSGISGVGVGVEGIINMKKAKRIVEEAEREYKLKHKFISDKVSDFINEDLKRVGELKIRANELRHNIAFSIERNMKALNNRLILNSLKINNSIREKDILGFTEEIRRSYESYNYLAGTAIKSVGVSALAYIGTTQLARTIGVAATGRAISTLTGIAAKRAMLAWLGGGAISAGGGGILLGSALLNAVTIAPGIMITGFKLYSKGEKALTEAERYTAKVKEEIKKIEMLSFVIDGAREKIALYERVLNRVMELIEGKHRDFLNKIKTSSSKHGAIIDDLRILILLIKEGLNPLIELQVINKEDFTIPGEVERIIKDVEGLIKKIV
jgi:hypothetical protein